LTGKTAGKKAAFFQREAHDLTSKLFLARIEMRDDGCVIVPVQLKKARGFAPAQRMTLNEFGTIGKAVFVGSINTVWPGALCYLEKEGEAAPKLADFNGKSVGGGATSPVQNIVPTWLEQNGLPKNHLKLLRMNPAVITSAFLEGQVDLAECWEGASLPILNENAQETGKKIGMIKYRDFGLDMYGSGFVTTEALLTEKPQVVDKFLDASYRGYEYMAQHPDEAADLIVKQYPTLKKSVVLNQIQQINALVRDPHAENKDLGFVRADRMEKTMGFVRNAFVVDDSIKTADLYRNISR
jgi:NitT/TauT family transport system substrate-binding protein